MSKIKEIMITRKNFIKEHKKLIPILRSGSKSTRIKEANDQAKELKARNK